MKRVVQTFVDSSFSSHICYINIQHY